MKVLLWVPIFDQVSEATPLFEEIKKTPPVWDDVLIIDSGSTDGSEAVIRGSGFKTLRLEKNRGVGYCYICAIDWALKNGFDIMVGVSGNGKMPPNEVSRLVGLIVSGECDYVTGSRFLKGGAYPNLPIFRRLAIPLVSLFAGLVVGARLTDATCGFRAFRLGLLKRADFDWRASPFWTYGFEGYFFAKVILDGGIRWKEVPVTMRYPERGKRYSKIRPFRDWFAILYFWIKARFDGKRFHK